MIHGGPGPEARNGSPLVPRLCEPCCCTPTNGMIYSTAATAVVEAKGIRATWRGNGFSPRLLESLQTQMTLGKARGRASGSTTELRLQLETGVQLATEVI